MEEIDVGAGKAGAMIYFVLCAWSNLSCRYEVMGAQAYFGPSLSKVQRS